MDFCMRLNDNKAGLEGLDKERINAIIKEASEGSLYTKHQEKRALRIQKRIEQQQEIISSLTPDQIRISELEMDRLARQLEEGRDLSRIIVHIDMDAFYAAVEMRDDPSLRNVPMAVGGIGMLSTSNYLARRFGVRAAMAGYIGKKLCPQLVIVPTNFRKYRAVSEQVRSIIAEYDPNFVSMGLDEAYLDITDCVRTRKANGELKTKHQRRRYGGECVCKLPRVEDTASRSDCTSGRCDGCGKERLVIVDEVSFDHSPEDVTNELRFRIEQETGLTASAGIASNCRLAKVCTDINKPNGQYLLPPMRENIMEFVRELPIRKINGIGGVTEAMLKAVGIETCKDLYDKRGLLASIHSPISSRFFLRVALGLGSSLADSWSQSDGDRRSIGVERTFPAVSETEQLVEICRKLCHKAADHMKKDGLKARTVILKVKTVEFETRTRAKTLDGYVSDFEPIFNVAKGILCKEIASAKPEKLNLRLLGVRLASFLHETEAHRLKLPDITRYLRQSGSKDSSAQVPSAAASVTSADEDSADSTCSVMALRSCSRSADAHCDDLIVDDDDDSIDEVYATTSAVPETNATDFSNDSVRVDDAANIDRDVEYKSATCPICNRRFSQSSLAILNAHIDQCLNRRTISSLIKEQDRELGAAVPAVSTNITKNNSGKRRSSNFQKKGDKKKVRNERASMESHSKKIEDYFKRV